MPGTRISVIDTLLGGMQGVTASYLVPGDSPALVETGARTSVPVLRAALDAAGVGEADLAWLVLTHVHLDHCGGAGDIAAAFPRARVVVHAKGARHLTAPERLVQATAEIFGGLGVLGDLVPVAEDRIVTAHDGMRIPVGPGRDLVVVDAPGHAWHHMALLDDATGTVMAGDALGVRMPGAGMYPTVPPPAFDLDASRATLATLRRLAPQRLLIGHFADVGDPGEALDAAERLQVLAAGAALRAWRRHGTAEAVGRAVRALVPPEVHIASPEAVARWDTLQWIENNTHGLAAWAGRVAA